MNLKYLAAQKASDYRQRHVSGACFLRFPAGALLWFVLMLLAPVSGHSQGFVLRYVNTTSGGITFSGNTLGLAKLSGANQPGTLDSIGGFITLNTNSQLGSYPPGTTLNWSNNSSAAVLQIPTNSTVLYAELMWAGTAQVAMNTSPTGDVLSNLNSSVQFIQPNGASNSIAPDPLTASIVTNGPANNPDALFYVRSANVTALVQAAGAGTYSVGGVPACVLASEDANNAAGWTLAVIYGNPSLHQRNLSLFIGNSFASTTAPTPPPVSIAGFCSPPTGPVKGYMFVSAIEGDPNKTGDEMLFGPATNSLQVLSGPNNIANNFFGGQINYCQPDATNNGLLDTSGTFGFSNSVPSSGTVTFSARQGWDITCVNVSSNLANGLQSAYVQNITQGDGYSLNALALQIDVGSPVLTTTQSVDKASTFVGDTLTYTVVVTNSGTADAVNLIFTDPLPFGTSFIANTFATNGVAIVGADPVNGVPIPIIKQNSSITFTYQVTVDQIPPSAKFITAATINFQYAGTCAQSPTINATLVNADVLTLAPLLNVSKQASLTNVIPGASLTYTIDVPNVGTTNTTGATLADPIPAGVAYVPNTTTLNGTNVPDVGGMMPFSTASEIHGPGRPAGQINVGDTAVVTFQVVISATPPARLNNMATIYADGVGSTNAQTAVANIPPVYSDLAIGINGTPNPVAAGGLISYTVSVTNNGPDSVNLITNFITLYFPLSTSILSPIYAATTGSYDPLTGVWSGILLPSNGVVTMTVSGTVSPTISASNISSSVTVAPPPGVLDLVTNNNFAAATNTVTEVADLAVTISDGVSNVVAGQSLNYTVTVLNFGPSTVNSVILSNSFSSYLTNLTLMAGQGTYNSGNGVWSGLNLGPGGSVILSAQATVSSNVIGAFTNVVTVAPPANVTDPVLTNNTASDVNAAYTNQMADLGIGKTAPSSVYAAGTLTYTLSITNFGPFAGSSVVVTDTLPAGVTFISASGNGTNSGGTVTWSLGALAAGQTSNLTVTVAAPAVGVNLTNVASVGPAINDPDLTNNTSLPVVTAVTPLADLMIAKTGPANVDAAGSLSYSISVTNLGPSSATNVVVTDTLPVGVAFVSASGNGTNNAGLVNWSLGALAASQASNLTVTVTAPASGTLTNIASVASPTADTNLLNNTTPPVVTSVTPVADLAIGKTGPAADPMGVSFSYLISVTNLGPSSAASLAVTDSLPAGLIFVSSLPLTTTNAANQVIWNLGLLASGATTNFSLTVQAASPGVFTNLASVGGPTQDNSLTNNISLPVVTTITNRPPPVAVNDNASTPENVAVTVPVLLNDSDPDGGTLTIIAVSTTNGMAIISGTNVVFTPPTNFVGTTTARYEIQDNYGGTNGALITIVVTNIPPLANPDSYTAAENSTNTLTPLANDVVETPGGVLQIIGVSPTNGTAVISGTNVIFTPTPDFRGTATIGYTITDGIGGTNSSLITVTVTNVAPLANPDSYAITENTTNLFAVLANDVVRTSGGSLSLVSVSTTNGTAAVSGTNVVFTPATNYLGTLTLTYTITDNVGGTNSSYVTVLVTNIPPLANPDSYTVAENSTNTLTPLANDVVETPGGVLQIIGVSPTNGTAVISGTNVIFTPTPDFRGTATIGYTIIDGIGGTNSSLITVTVTNLAPVANPDSYAITENTTNLFAVLANDVVRTSGGSLSLVSVSTTNGTAAVSGTNVVFTPAPNYLGTLTLTYTITDNVGGTNSSYVNVLVTNIPPLASPDSYTVAENSTNTLTPLVNDVVETLGGVLQIIGVSPTNGTAVISGTNVVFTPTPDFRGTATIGYTISDGIGGTNSSLITVTVTNVPPMATSQPVTTDENEPVQITLTGTDPNHLPLTFAIVTNPLNGRLTGFNTNTGVLTYTPGTNFAGADSFTFLVNNGQTNSAPATVAITVAPVADLVVVQSGPATGWAGSNLVFTVSVTNLGPASATGITVSNQLAAGFKFVNASGGGIASGNLIVWSVAALPANGVTNFTVTAVAQEGGSYTNIASGASTVLDLNPTNNNGSLAGAQTVTVLAPVVDLVVFKVGATQVYAGAQANYVITVSNAGPSTATSVVAHDTLPAGALFQNASGTYSVSNGVVTWSGLTLSPGAATQFNLTVLASPTVASFVNIASATSPAYDPDPTNNNGSAGGSRVTTVVTPSADIIAAITGPATAIVGSNLVFTLSLTNAGPSTASNVVAKDVLPQQLVFVLASAGGTNSNGTNGGGIITWPSLPALVAGGATNFTFTARALTVGLFTNIVSSTSTTYDPNPTNNTGVLPTAQAQTQVSLPQFTILAGAPVFNPQDGLYEEQVTVTNNGATTVAGIQLYAGGLRSGVSLYNAVGTNGGVPYVQYAFPLDPGNTVHFVLEFYDPLRRSLTNTLFVVAYLPSSLQLTNASNSVPVNKVFTDTRTQPARFVIEWASVSGTTYLVLYANSLTATNWYIATPSVTATANVTQWYDDGPPETISVPQSVNDRFYRVISY
jgi:uncharacterized repeat protein (TIGR01451 family)